ncbi:peptidase A4 family-domain-containing protein [Aspergillus pseudotamarii]|uniref:Peptidase A4 family-domain-containing protein n=1 Tax=Aspergillus pseudotamarii TaxID=132259 RepID=A0A5N6SNF3_ASPPS|nr:peptidase A4 family-domain-containing protein [Aspergillus pseudotamarii]KAE8135399.1 peptidase A4 family-domain-containing protein [Aspergillus pseudotamarii]
MSVTETFTVPTPSASSGGSSDERYFVAHPLTPSMERYPGYANDFRGITFSVGDTAKVTVNASSKTGGAATVENQTSGKAVTHIFTSQSDNALCETYGEWIMEGFSSLVSLVSFINFGIVAFTNIIVTSGGSIFFPSTFSFSLCPSRLLFSGFEQGQDYREEYGGTNRIKPGRAWALRNYV